MKVLAIFLGAVSILISSFAFAENSGLAIFAKKEDGCHVDVFSRKNTWYGYKENFSINEDYPIICEEVSARLGSKISIYFNEVIMLYMNGEQMQTMCRNIYGSNGEVVHLPKDDDVCFVCRKKQ